MHAEYAKIIHAPADEVWPYLHEEEKMKEYMDGLEEFSKTNDMDDGVGAMYRMRVKEGGKELTFKAVVMEWEPERKLLLDTSGGQFKGVHAKMGFELHPEGDLTKLTCTLDIDESGLGFLARMFMGAAKKQSEAKFETYLSNLDHVLRVKHVNT